MKTKKMMLALLPTLALFSACSEDVETSQQVETASITQISNDLSIPEAQKEFAIVLSKAVYNNEEFRSFIKGEAIKQVDNDYDVFYPIVKDKEVVAGKTFRNILLENGINSERLNLIEHTLPLLTIYVPDLSLFTNISANNWDTEDREVPVTIADKNKSVALYCNGELSDSLESDEIPDFHLLVIKDNERICQSATRSGGEILGNYQFIDKAFDGINNPQKIQKETRTASDVNIDGDYLPAYQLPSGVISAWNVMKSTDLSLQRDNIYYGLTPQKTEGKLNRTINEYLYRFQIDPKAYFQIADQRGTEDKHDDPMVDKNRTTTNMKVDLSDDEVIKRLWTDGNFEIHFEVFSGNKTATPYNQKFTFNVAPKDLFDIKIQRTRKHHTMFRHTKYTYRIDPSEMGRKWYVIREHSGYDARLDTWNLEQTSLEKFFAVSEIDESESYTKSFTIENTYTSNFKGEISGGDSDIKYGLGYNASNSQKTTSTVSVQVNKASDELGTLTASFYDPVIIEYNQSKGGYRLKNISNGTVTITLLPMDPEFTRSH